ncbi:MAG TPA: alpha-galactosidase, partial [Microlunatus sp.]|nr:alpha-galactosidase [Microlunatus sp.]
MTVLPSDVQVGHATPAGEVTGFVQLATSLHDHDPAGTTLAELRLPGRTVEVEWLHPFSWDSADRGVVTATRRLGPGELVCLHAGPYGTADAAAHRDGVGMEFPLTGDGHRYRPDDVLPPQPHDDHQDTAAWLVARVGGRHVSLAWEYSGHLIMTVEVVADQVVIRSVLPADTYAPAPDERSGPGPTGWLCVGPGDLDEGAAALRRLIIEEMITLPDLSGMPGSPGFPCLVANSWGVQENTSTTRILEMMDATAAVGAEVFVVDKGWERSVGDWLPNDRFPSGLRALSEEARRRGMGFGVWCGWGNADPRSPVALQHPDWLTTWRGHIPVLSFDNHGLCLGHDPARDWVLDELSRMVTDFGLTWLLHDFETIARCDSTQHTHDPGAGEHAAEAAFHHI